MAPEIVYNFPMSAVIFDGTAFAAEREEVLQRRIQNLAVTPRLASVVFAEDPTGQLYTRLKMEAAARVGVEFDKVEVSFKDDLAHIQERIHQTGVRDDIHGMLVQKPSKQLWKTLFFGHSERSEESISLRDVSVLPQHDVQRTRSFEDWWRLLTAEIPVAKDVDCLTQENLQKVYRGEWQLVPATVKAVLMIGLRAKGIGDSEDLHLQSVLKRQRPFSSDSIAVIGRSELVGRPLSAVLSQAGARVSLLGSTDDLVDFVPKADMVVGATGVSGLIGGGLIKKGAVVIDVGSPQGDIVFREAKEKASFITPVPEGVGPVTVVSLLENLVELIDSLH